MRVLITDSNGERVRERAEQLLIDGHDPLLAASAARGAPQAGRAAGRRPALRPGRPGRDHRVPTGAAGRHAAPRRQSRARDRDRRRHRLRPHPLLPGRRRRAAAVQQVALLIAAALEAVHRRAGAPPPRLLSIAGVTIDLDARTVQAENQPLELTRLEFDLLRTLASQPGRTFTRDEITREVWGYEPAAGGGGAHERHERDRARRGGRPSSPG